MLISLNFSKASHRLALDCFDERDFRRAGWDRDEDDDDDDDDDHDDGDDENDDGDDKNDQDHNDNDDEDDMKVLSVGVRRRLVPVLLT